MKIILIIVILLLIGGFLIISNENIRLNSLSNFKQFTCVYSSLLTNSYSKSVELTGKVIEFFNN